MRGARHLGPTTPSGYVLSARLEEVFACERMVGAKTPGEAL